MSTINDPQTESPAPEPASEELVAYLDGELSPDDCRQVEERLASDADYRQQLRELDQAWEALDSLPSTSVDDDFARTTIEMVALAAREEQNDRSAEAVASSRKRRRRWAIFGGVAVLLSFVAARLLLPNANARLLGDLPVITQMDLLAQIQDVDFLRRLSEEVPFEKLATDEAAVKREVANFKAASDTSPEARQQWIESLPPEQKADLAAQANQFDDLPKVVRDRLKKLEQQIAAVPDSDQLQKTLSAYGQWLNRRSNGEQSDLRSMSTDDRLRRIRELLRQDSQLAAQRLSPEDAKKLREEIPKIYNQYKEKYEDFVTAMRRRDRDDRPRRPEGSPNEKALFVAGWALLWNRDIEDKTQERIVKELSPQAQEHLGQLLRRDGERSVKTQLWLWMRGAMQPNRDAGDIERFFAEELDKNQREHLLSLRKDEMEAELERRYFGAKFGLRGAEWLGNFGEPGRGPGLGGPQGPLPRDAFNGGRRFNRPPGEQGRDGPPGPDDRRRRRPPPDRPPFGPPNGPPPPEPGGQEPI